MEIGFKTILFFEKCGEIFVETFLEDELDRNEFNKYNKKGDLNLGYTDSAIYGCYIYLNSHIVIKELNGFKLKDVICTNDKLQCILNRNCNFKNIQSRCMERVFRYFMSLSSDEINARLEERKDTPFSRTMQFLFDMSYEMQELGDEYQEAYYNNLDYLYESTLDDTDQQCYNIKIVQER